MSHISKFCSPLAQQGPGSRLAASVEAAQGVSAPTPDDFAGMAWYNAASEDTRRFWHGIAGTAVPVDAWIAYRDTAGTVCPSPAPQIPIDSLAVPAEFWFDAQDLATRFFWIDRASEQLGLSHCSVTDQQCFEAFCAFSTCGVSAPAEAGQGVGTPSYGDYSAASVDHLDARCTSCAWTGPLWKSECFCHVPPAVVLGCPACASALVLVSQS